MLEPIEECRLEDSAAAKKGVAGEPDKLGFAEAETPRGFELFPQLLDVDDFAELHGGGAIDERECGAGAGKFFQMNWSMRSL